MDNYLKIGNIKIELSEDSISDIQRILKLNKLEYTNSIDTSQEYKFESDIN